MEIATLLIPGYWPMRLYSTSSRAVRCLWVIIVSILQENSTNNEMNAERITIELLWSILDIISRKQTKFFLFELA